MSTLPPDSAASPAPATGTDHDALPPGTRFGEFEIVRVLGVGGFGIVYLAKDHSLEREVALKEYMPASLASRGLGPQITVRSSSFAETYAIGLRSFVNEARLLARFDHPSLVKVYRFWEDNATAYMVMPFLQGTTLRDTRRRMAHPPDEAWIRSVISPILSALELLHREGVYHRDIAPDNILLPLDGPPVLLDFGAARRVISDRTQSLTAILKPSYAPIEQYAEMTQLRQGPWTDLYALGAVIHYLLYGTPPAPATARAVQDDPDQIESRIVPGVSPRFLEAVWWMLSIRPNQRPQNGEQLRTVLDGNASVPPRGRPGITVPPKLAGAAAPAAAYEPTRHVEPTAPPTRVQTAHIPTYLPTARVAPPGQARAATFSPTAEMPSPRAAQAPLDTTVVAPPTPARPTTVPPPSGGRPSEWPQSRPATLPPPLPAAPASRPAPLETPAARSRPAPLAGGAAPPASVRAAAAAKPGSSKIGLVLVGLLALVVVGAAAVYAGKRDSGPTEATVPAPTTAAPVVVASPPAPMPQPSQAAATPDPTPNVAAPLPSAVSPATAGATTLPDEMKATPSLPVRPPPGVAHSDSPIDGTTRPASAAGTDHVAANPDSAASRPHPGSRPVPRSDTDATASGSLGNPSARPPESSSYGSARPPGTPAPPPTGHPVPAAVPGARPVPEDQPATAREACGNRSFFALAICMDDRCEEPRYRNSEECQAILAKKRAREGH
jgi:Protein kinase domain